MPDEFSYVKKIRMLDSKYALLMNETPTFSVKTEKVKYFTCDITGEKYPTGELVTFVDNNAEKKTVVEVIKNYAAKAGDGRWYRKDMLKQIRRQHTYGSRWKDEYILVSRYEACRECYFECPLTGHTYTTGDGLWFGQGEESKLISLEGINLNSSTYFICNMCARAYHIDDIREDSVCRYCLETMVGHPSSWCDRVLNHNANILEYISNPVSLKPKTIYYGVELEHEYRAKTRTEFKNTVDTLYGLTEGKCIIKHDGSLNRGAELVTVPLEFDEQLYLFRDFFNASAPLFSPFGEKTGMHVHVSKKPLTELHIGKILKFMNDPDNRDFICDISGRMNGQYAAYAECSVTAVKKRRSRYTCLNITENTIEFRIFKSPNSYRQFAYRLEFCKAVLNFCKIQGIKNLNVKEFLKFLNLNRKEYSFLYSFVSACV